MGRRGPKPTPTRLLEAAGSWRAKARKKQGEPAPPPLTKARSVAGAGAVPAVPKELGKRGARMWRETAARLVAMNVLTEADLDRLLSMCKAWEDYWAADACVQKYGILVETVTTTGDVRRVQNPAVLERHRAWMRYKNESDSFGLTPAARPRLIGAADDKPAAADGKERFFKPRLA